MKTNSRRAVVVAGAMAATVLATTVVDAAPLSIAPRGDVMAAPSVDQVAYRRRVAYRRYGYRGGRRYYYNPAGAAVAGAALGLIGAGIAAAAAPTYGYYPAYGYPYGYGYGGYPYYGW
jgi:hypothetical protein